jgi:hypothetical protein
MNSILVEIEDGFKVITSRYAIRKRTACTGVQGDHRKAIHVKVPVK